MNGYFNLLNGVSRHTLARAEAMNALFKAIEGGFDKLPTEAELKEGRVTYAPDTGAANAYVVNLPYAPEAYTEGLEVAFKAANANTGPSTINVNGLGVKGIRRFDGSPLAAGDLPAGAMVVLRYDGSNFRLAVGAQGIVNTARDWATKTGGSVDGSEYSSKEYAVGSVAPAGSAKRWATEAENVPVSGGEYSAKHYAAKASASRVAAQAAQGGAEAAEASAIAHYRLFRGTFYGELPADPTLDPNGNPPNKGDWYFNSTVGNCRIFNGTSWDDIGSGSLNKFTFTAAGGETSLSGPDDNGRPLAYSVGRVLVAKNGALLVEGRDVTADDGTSLTNLKPLAAGAVVSVYAFSTLSLGSLTADGVETADGGTVQQAIAVAADTAALLASTEQFTVGSTIRTADGLIYKVAAPSAADHHVTTAGGVKLYVVPGNMGEQPYKAWARPSTANLDNTASINAAIRAGSEVTIPAGDWRVDGSIDLYGGKTMTFAPGARLVKRAEYTSDTAPLIYMRDNFTQLFGVNLLQSTNSPEGALHIGYRDGASLATNHQYWRVLEPSIEANNVVGSLGIVLDSAEWKGGGVNYNGVIQNPILRYCDIPIQVREICNSHQIFNPQVFMARTYAIELRGAYANNVIGGFLHGSHNGVIGLALRQRQRGSSHHSTENTIIGFNIEPGGGASRGLRIEQGCIGNTVLVKAGTAGGNEILETAQNIIDLRWGIYYNGRPTNFTDFIMFSGTHTARGRAETKRRPQQTGIKENTEVDLFRVQVGSHYEAILELNIQCRYATLGRGSAISAKVRISRSTGNAVVGTPVGLIDGDAGTLSFVVTNDLITVRFTTTNNGTATTGVILADATLHQYRDEAVSQNTSLLTVL